MSKQLIYTGEGFLEPTQMVEDSSETLRVSELFFDTVQGEGIYAGTPAAFLRLAGCPVNCKWCDSKALWTKAKTFTISELVNIFQNTGILERLSKRNHHLVVTGGSPMLQQKQVARLLTDLTNQAKSPLFVEVENEASLTIEAPGLVDLVSHWNLSPKLGNSGVDRKVRYNEKALSQFSLMDRNKVTFKFVVSDNFEEDWQEIYTDFIKPGYALRSQIMLMPKGASREELTVEVKEKAIEWCIKEGVRYGGRLHIDIWDKKTGV